MRGLFVARALGDEYRFERVESVDDAILSITMAADEYVWLGGSRHVFSCQRVGVATCKKVKLDLELGVKPANLYFEAGEVWVTTYGKGGHYRCFRFLPDGGSNRVPIQGDKGVSVVAQGGRGVLLGGDTALYELSDKGLRFVERLENPVTAMLVRDDKVWVGTEKGIVLADIQGGDTEDVLGHADDTVHLGVRSFFAAKKKVWVRTEKGLLRYEDATKLFFETSLLNVFSLHLNVQDEIEIDTFGYRDASGANPLKRDYSRVL